MVEQLAREHQQELAAAGTLVNLEELTAGIGDEFGRQLRENKLASRSERGVQMAPMEPPICTQRPSKPKLFPWNTLRPDKKWGIFSTDPRSSQIES